MLPEESAEHRRAVGSPVLPMWTRDAGLATALVASAAEEMNDRLTRFLDPEVDDRVVHVDPDIEDETVEVSRSVPKRSSLWSKSSLRLSRPRGKVKCAFVYDDALNIAVATKDERRVRLGQTPRHRGGVRPTHDEEAKRRGLGHSVREDCWPWRLVVADTAERWLVGDLGAHRLWQARWLFPWRRNELAPWSGLAPTRTSSAVYGAQPPRVAPVPLWVQPRYMPGPHVRDRHTDAAFYPSPDHRTFYDPAILEGSFRVHVDNIVSFELGRYRLIAGPAPRPRRSPPTDPALLIPDPSPPDWPTWTEDHRTRQVLKEDTRKRRIDHYVSDVLAGRRTVDRLEWLAAERHHFDLGDCTRSERAGWRRVRGSAWWVVLQQRIYRREEGKLEQALERALEKRQEAPKEAKRVVVEVGIANREPERHPAPPSCPLPWPVHRKRWWGRARGSLTPALGPYPPELVARLTKEWDAAEERERSRDGGPLPAAWAAPWVVSPFPHDRSGTADPWGVCASWPTDCPTPGEWAAAWPGAWSQLLHCDTETPTIPALLGGSLEWVRRYAAGKLEAAEAALAGIVPRPEGAAPPAPTIITPEDRERAERHRAERAATAASVTRVLAGNGGVMPRAKIIVDELPPPPRLIVFAEFPYFPSAREVEAAAADAQYRKVLGQFLPRPARRAATSRPWPVAPARGGGGGEGDPQPGVENLAFKTAPVLLGASWGADCTRLAVCRASWAAAANRAELLRQHPRARLRPLTADELDGGASEWHRHMRKWGASDFGEDGTAWGRLDAEQGPASPRRAYSPR
jgi:hypothetical protein